MINLLVVDDEPIIANSLYQMLRDTTTWPLTVFKALNGTQAMEIARSNRIDVLVTDICMPNIDGLTLQGMIKAEWPNCRVVFLTGYDSFEFAQQAIRLKGDGYVLKIEGDAVILATLDQCIQAIEEERQNQRLMQNIKAALPILQREFIQSLLQNQPYHDENITELLQTMEFTLDPEQPVLMLLVRVHPTKGGTGIADATRCNAGKAFTSTSGLGCLFNMIGILEKYLDGIVRQIAVTQPPDVIVLLYQPFTEGSWRSAYTHVLASLEQIQETGLRLLGLSTVYAITAEPCELADIAAKRQDLEAALRFFAFDDCSIITHEMLAKNADLKPKKYHTGVEQALPNQQQLRQLKLSISMGDAEGMSEFLRDICMKARAENLPGGLVRDIYFSLALVFQRCINEIDANTVQWQADPEQLMNMDAHFSWRKVNDYLRDIGLSIILSRSTEKSEWNQNLVAQINQYVGDHLAEDISLVSIADRFHFHPSYLARLYKHFTGITLGQYIINMKVSQARKMLGSSTLMINDIAKLLGFSSVAYFSKFFKINCGMTPSDFRRQNMTGEG